MAAKVTLIAIQNLLQTQTASFVAEIQSLRDEVGLLRTELAAAQERFSKQASLPAPPASSSAMGAKDHSFADVVKASVCSAIEEEKSKNEIVIQGLPENDHDEQDVRELCTRASVNVKPVTVNRLGKPNPDRPRRLKASFPTPFDARTFMAKVDECKESDPVSFPIRVRPGRTREQQALSSKVYKLNQKARSGESFSLRNNAEVWMYKKSDDGKWLRVTDWTFSDSEQGNGDQTPSSQTARKTPA